MTASPAPIITAYTLRHVVTCARHVWLDAHGDPALHAAPGPETLRLYALGTQHEHTVQAATAGALVPVEIESWAEGVSATHDLMRQGVPAILGAFLEYRAPLDLSGQDYVLRARIDRLVRTAQHGDWLYAPVEIKQHTRPDPADWVQLDFYVWLLGLVQGALPPAELWLGADDSGQPRARLPHDYDEARLLDALARAADLLAAPTAPAIVLAPHCTACPWQTACRASAEQAGALDLLYGVSRTTRAQLRQAGLTSLAHVAAQTPDALQQVKGIGPATAPAIRANAQAWVEGRPIWYRALPDVGRQPGWMFDLETWEIGGKTVPWCMGWCDPHGHTRIALVAPVQAPETLILADGQAVTLVPDSDGAWEVLADSVETEDDALAAAPIFHWTAYDVGMLRATAPRAVRERLEPRMADLHRLFTRTVSLPQGSTSIKVVSTYLGFPWQGYTDWFAAYQDYRYWLDAGRLDALTRACTYQRADVQSMAWVWRWLAAHAPPEG